MPEGAPKRVEAQEATDPYGQSRRALPTGADGVDACRKVMAVDRLTAEDRLILWPDEIWPQDVGALAVLDGGSLLESDGRFRIDAAREAIEGRLRLLPRFRHLLYVPRRGLGGPLWVDAPAFDLAESTYGSQKSPPRATRRKARDARTAGRETRAADQP